MSRKKILSKKQFTVINDIFAGELDEQAVLDKYNVSRNIYNKWQREELFGDEFDRQIAVLNRRGALIIARYAEVAAAKLVQLMDSEKPETARKACLDVIGGRNANNPGLGSLAGSAKRAEQSASGGDDSAVVSKLAPETAGKLLAVLAEEDGSKK